MLSQIQLYSGFTPAQYDGLLTPVNSTYLTEITMFFRRVVHLILHCEWITDATLVDRLLRHVHQPHNAIDDNVQKIYQAFRTRLVDSYKKPILESQLHALQQKIDPAAHPLPQNILPESLKTPFTIDLHHLAGNDWNTEKTELFESLPLAYENNFLRVELKELPKRIRAILVQIDAIFKKNINTLKASKYEKKEEYISRLHGVLQSIHAHYDHFQEHIQKYQGKEVLYLSILIINGELDEASRFRQRIYPSKPFSELTKALREIEEELGIYQQLRRHIENVLNGIMHNDPHWQLIHPQVKNYPLSSRESVAKDLRLCRQFIIERSLSHALHYGKSQGGDSSLPFEFLKDVVNSQIPKLPFSEMIDYSVDNGRLICRNKKTDQKYWAPIYERSNERHCWPGIYTLDRGIPKFIVLDNVSGIKSLPIDELKTNPLGIWTNFMLAFPELDPPPRLTPCPETWIIPQWENNNCFFSSAVIHLAVMQFYRMQK